MITKFDEFLNEEFKKGSYEEYIKNKPKPELNEFGASVGDKEIEGEVGDLIKFAYDNDYPIEDFDMKDLTKIGGWGTSKEELKYWTVYDKDQDKMVPYLSLSKEKQKKAKEEVEEDINKSDIEYPIIVSIDKNGKPNAILDGNHRAQKSHNLKKKTLKGFAIPENDVLKKFKKK